MLTVRLIDVADVLPYERLAARDHIGIKPEQKMVSQWFGAFAGPQLVGFAAIGRLSAHRWRIRAVWVRPGERGQGVSGMLHGAMFQWLAGHGESDDVVDLWHNHHLNPDFYTERGLPPTGKRKREGRGARHHAGTIGAILSMGIDTR